MKQALYNPVLVKEIKLRFRSLKSFMGILFYLIAMCIFVFGFIMLTTSFTGTGYFRPEESFFLFSMLTYIQLGLILFITPGLTAGAISTEREKQTLNILLTTSQTSLQIILGKLTSSIAFLLLMVLAGLPIYSLVFLFGGVSPGQLGIIFLFYFLTMITIGGIGIMFSTIIRKTIVAMIATYGTMIFLTAVTGFIYLVITGMNSMATGSLTSSPIGHFFASINPVVLMLTLISPGSDSFITETTKIEFPIWAGYTIFYVVITILSLFIAVKKLRVNMKRSK
ncbi:MULTISPECIES: ABC transporter permease [Bacillaceae]|uniref:ABC transporter permease n=1 Tax=Bacillaceae TaxID=186817 RepID=UPI0006AE814C|nr:MULTISPECIES: ABC transporter permease [Bacillaceae]ALC86225.1 ABC transporter permease [Bacillus sp. FJAT-22090]KQL36630.1 ABC transporter permease [Psychrobacillus sp. FJAT-21963]